MNITTVGIDLAKTVFQVHGVDDRGKAVLRKAFKRSDLTKYFANLPQCLIGMEACASAHYWARNLEELGHTVRLMAPQFVKPYVKTNKNDARDAEAICEAVSRPNMRFVPIKNVVQNFGISDPPDFGSWGPPDFVSSDPPDFGGWVPPAERAVTRPRRMPEWSADVDVQVPMPMFRDT